MSLGAASMIPAGMARADVAGQMNDFFQDAGGAANVTGPSVNPSPSAPPPRWTTAPASDATTREPRGAAKIS